MYKIWELSDRMCPRKSHFLKFLSCVPASPTVRQFFCVWLGLMTVHVWLTVFSWVWWLFVHVWFTVLGCVWWLFMSNSRHTYWWCLTVSSCWNDSLILCHHAEVTRWVAKHENKVRFKNQWQLQYSWALNNLSHFIQRQTTIPKKSANKRYCIRTNNVTVQNLNKKKYIKNNMQQKGITIFGKGKLQFDTTFFYLQWKYNILCKSLSCFGCDIMDRYDQTPHFWLDCPVLGVISWTGMIKLHISD